MLNMDWLRVTDRATRYGPALKLAQTILEESELPGKSLTLVSDLQRGGWTGEEGVQLPEGTRVTMAVVGEPPPGGLAGGALCAASMGSAGSAGSQGRGTGAAPWLLLGLGLALIGLRRRRR